MSEAKDLSWERQKWKEERYEKGKDRRNNRITACISAIVALSVPVVSAWATGAATNKGDANFGQNVVTGASQIVHVFSPVQPVIKVADERRVSTPAAEQVKPTATVAAPPVSAGPNEQLLNQLRASLGDANPDNREAAAQDAISKAKDEISRLLILRTIYRTKDPTLRSMAILYELKALEAKQIPVSFLQETDDKNAASTLTTSDDSLATSLIGSSLAIKAVDLASGSWNGSYQTGHGVPRDFRGTVTDDAVQLTSIVDLGPNNPLSLQLVVKPQDNFKLVGKAIGVNAAGKRMETAVELPLPE